AAWRGAQAAPELECPIRAVAPPEMRARPQGGHREALTGSPSENAVDFVVAEPKQVRPVTQLDSRRPERVTERPAPPDALGDRSQDDDSSRGPDAACEPCR